MKLKDRMKIKEKKHCVKRGTEHKDKVWLIYPKNNGFLVYSASNQQPVLYMVAEIIAKLVLQN